jgi:transposase-like protein
MKSPKDKKKKWRRRSPEECRRIVSDYFSSGENLWRFSQSVEFSYGSLRNWVKRYGCEAKKDQANSQSFVELRASPIGQAGIAALVRLPSGAEVTLHTGCDSALAQTLIKSLR